VTDATVVGHEHKYDVYSAQLERFSTDSKLQGGQDQSADRANGRIHQFHSHTLTSRSKPVDTDPALLEPVKSKVKPDLLFSSPPSQDAYPNAPISLGLYSGGLVHGYYDEVRYEHFCMYEQCAFALMRCLSVYNIHQFRNKIWPGSY